MNVNELKEALHQNANLVLIDVREPHEYKICKIPSALLMPMSQFASYMPLLPENKDLVVYCHHGIRSAMVVRYLEQQGYRGVKNLEGGIDQWALRVDVSIPRY